MRKLVSAWVLATAALAAESPDIRSVPADLTIPALAESAPAPGARVKHFLPEYAGTQIYHVLYLPTDWKPGARFPVIVEYAGNGGYSNKYGDVSLGVPEGSKLGYGISAGKGFIWICLPYIEVGRQKIATKWWGDVEATLDYCKKAVRMVCWDFGGDPAAVILTGFSRGAIGCGYLGLHDDEIAKLWRAFIPYSHYDGVTQWPYPASDAASAIERLKRINGRPSFICHEGTVEKTREFIAASGVQAPFTFQAVPFRNHNDEWVLRPSPARAALREWLRGVLDAPGLVSVRRLAENPIICPAMLPGKDGDNINGPSLIRVPAWLPNSLGKYYLYFANHHGKYIRLAYANRLEGPWKIFPGGVLNLKEAPGATGHIASPDVHIDNERHELRLYFHGPAKAGKGQMTFYSSSKDGKHFTADATPLCPFYLRAFRWDGMWYGLAKSGQLYRSPDGRVPFTSGGNPLPGGRDSDSKTAVYPRHVAVDLRGDTLWVYWSNIGDAPEHILCGRLRLTGDWTTWKVTDVRSLLRPEQPWEGASLPVKKSSSGAASRAVHQLRDPVVFVDDDGRSYLLYSVAGESGVAIAELLLYSTTKP